MATSVLNRLGAAFAAGLLALGLGLPLMVSAQGSELPSFAEETSADDPPGRVGRLSEVQGTVWLFHPQQGEWIAAVRNRPVTSGDRLSTEPGARLEMRIGSSAFRLDGGTDIEIDRLDDEAIDIRLINGSVLVRLRNDEAARDLLLATDDGSFTPLGAGTYRIDRRDATSAITVWAGQAAYNGPQSALTVYQGQRAVFWIDTNRQAQYNLGQPQLDAFASWSGELDRLDARGQATAYVSSEMTGAEDLDRYGRWSQDPEHGALWVPNQVASDWAPYSAGHWAWVSPWGWSWVDDAPWGFAPFHYGRWVMVRDRWSWAPGRYVARPVYSPALVGWVGGGVGVSLTIGGGRGIGWFPLAPHEAWVPSYRVSRGYMRGVNHPHFRNRGEVERLIQTPSVLRSAEYRNRKFHHGTTAIPIEAFNRRGDGRGRIAIEPNGRFNPPADQLDRLPVSTTPGLPRPSWADRRQEAGDRPGNRDGRQFGRPFRQRPGIDERRDARFERQRNGDLRSTRDIDPIRPPVVVPTLPTSVQPPPIAQRPFVQPDEPRAEWPRDRSGRRGPAVEPPQAPVGSSVATQPFQNPPPVERGDSRFGRPDRADRGDRGERPERGERFERPDRPFERIDRRGGRQDPVAAPEQMQRPPAIAAPQPAIIAPAPAIIAPAPAIQQQPVMRPPRDRVQPTDQAPPRQREGRESGREMQGPGAQPDRSGNVREGRTGRNPREVP